MYYMENIFKIIYDKSVKNELLSLKDLDKRIEILVIEKNLNDYILNINFQSIRGNNLASYSYSSRTISIYTEKIKEMLYTITNSIILDKNLEISLYKNISILQIILHEVEHANQNKIAYSNNSLEALILRLSYLVNNRYNDELYEICPEERLAEIKSFDEIILLTNTIYNKFCNLSKILDMEKLKRLLRGYHYTNNSINVPINTYLILGNKTELLSHIEGLYNNINYSLSDRLKYGFQINNNEYKYLMKKLVLSLSKNFDNKINMI